MNGECTVWLAILQNKQKKKKSWERYKGMERVRRSERESKIILTEVPCHEWIEVRTYEIWELSTSSLQMGLWRGIYPKIPGSHFCVQLPSVAPQGRSISCWAWGPSSPAGLSVRKRARITAECRRAHWDQQELLCLLVPLRQHRLCPSKASISLHLQSHMGS